MFATDLPSGSVEYTAAVVMVSITLGAVIGTWKYAMNLARDREAIIERRHMAELARRDKLHDEEISRITGKAKSG